MLKTLLYTISFVVVGLSYVSCSQAGPDLPADEDVEMISNPDPLSLWNDTPRKAAIIEFVNAVVQEGGQDFVPPGDRIAVFDNDGTLWCEQPLYIQLVYALDAAKEMAASDASLRVKEPFKSLIAGDMAKVMAGGEAALIEILKVTHANNSTEEFENDAMAWLASAKHPRFDRAYDELTYAPMVELLLYLRENDFKTFIVTGGGIDFVRFVSQDVYGIPAEQVVGSSLNKEYVYDDSGNPMIKRLPEIFFVDDKAGKPVGIHNYIGKRPIAAFGNSDGDYEMIEWSTAGSGRRLGAFVHHTDADREYAYDREGHIGVLKRGMDNAADNGWLLIDMKEDWKEIF